MKKYNILLFVVFLIGCSKEYISENQVVNPTEPVEDLREFTILYTNDEHGWIEKTGNSNGAANMMGLWEEKEGYNGDESFLILSGGDNWLGPPISNQFKGESVVDVMNTMEYDVAVIGNHEFEYGIQNLYTRKLQANFEYISANIRKKGTNDIPPLFTPYTIKEVNGILIGIVGLSPIGTPNNTVSKYVEDLEFLDYSIALEEIVPLIKSEGAELIILLAHISYTELIKLAPKLIELGISVAGGGHCHREMTPQVISTENGDIAIFQSTKWFDSYVRTTITFDKLSNKVTNYDMIRNQNINSEIDTTVQNVVVNWKNRLVY